MTVNHTFGAIRRTLSMLLVVSLALATAGPAFESVALASTSSADAIPLAGKVQAPSSGAYTGVFRQPAPFSSASLDQYQVVAGKTPSVVMWYQPWASQGMSDFDKAACVSLYERGIVPLITWEPWNPGGDPNWLANPGHQPAYSLAKIIDGSYDSYIRQWARDIKSLGGPVMLRPMHEMNGNWYPWGAAVNGNTPAQYVSAWRHIHNIFAAESATNVTWVWSINWWSPVTSTYAEFYPGNAYVDWTAISGLNFGTTRPTSFWRSFENMHAKPIEYLTSLKKPIMIAETGSVTAGGDKAAWIRDTYSAIAKKYPQVKAIVYYDKREVGLKGDQDFNITTSKSDALAYRAALSSGHYVTTPAALSNWRSRLTTTQLSSLTSIPARYSAAVSPVTPEVSILAPTTIVTNSTATITGTVTWYGCPLPARTVWIERSEDGVTWEPLRTLTTNSAGSYSFTHKPTSMTYYRAKTLGDDAFSAVTSPRSSTLPREYLKAERLGGRDRYASAVLLADQLRADRGRPFTDVIVACGEDRAMADPLGAAGLASAYESAVLLTHSGQMPSVTRNAINAMRNANGGKINIHVIGGTAVVPDAIYKDLSALKGTGKIQRINGRNRYDTARLMAEKIKSVKGDVSAVMVVNIQDTKSFNDALAASPIAAAKGVPLIGVMRDKLPSEAAAALKLFPNAKRYAVNSAHLTASVRSAAKCESTPMATSSNRETAATQIAKFGVDNGYVSYKNAGLVNNLADALPAGAMIGQMDGVLLYTNVQPLSGTTSGFIGPRRAGVESGWVLGGPVVITDATKTSFEKSLN